MIRFLLGISIIIISAGASDADIRLAELIVPTILGAVLLVSGGFTLIRDYDE